MAAFIKLDDSPMFHKQIFSLEQTADDLRDRCQQLYKGCNKFMSALGDACSGDTDFADSLEAFGGGHDDPVSLSIGGPVISKFVTAFRELATYKELLRSQVEHVLVDRLMHFMTVDLQDGKDSRRRFDKAAQAYDQAREKVASLKKSSREDIVSELEEDLQNSKSTFERSRFNLVNALVNIEAKKKYEFLESFSGIMDAHLRYFKLGYNLLSQMEPFIHQILTYAQQTKEMANSEQDRLAKRIQEFRTQEELDNLRASSNVEATTSVNGVHVVGTSSYKDIQALMQATSKGEVQTIKQGYLLKRSSSMRTDWKRRFFVLNSHGTLYYYRSKGTKSGGSSSLQSTGTADSNSGVFGRFRSRQHRASSLNKENLGYRTIDLHTSTIKVDAEDPDLRLCFRIISPSKTYTLQAENATDRIDWVNKITAVIASLLNSQLLDQHLQPETIDMASYMSAAGAPSHVSSLDKHESLEDVKKEKCVDSVSKILRKIPGNDFCAECSAPEPDWASLNLGILLCIQCSGLHRNLGVHISKVRSITLDVKVWEPTILDLFSALGNAYCNSVWEELLPHYARKDQPNKIITSITKPCADDAIFQKEKYIQAKYVEKLFINKETTEAGQGTSSIWEAVKSNNLRAVYQLLVTLDAADIINTTYDEVDDVDLYHPVDTREDFQIGSFHATERDMKYDPAACERIKNCCQGCSLLHLACHGSNFMMVELLLQFGADVNMRDFHGRTPIHHCIAKGNNPLAKYLLRRGACPSIKDGGGLSALERAMEMGAITDEELFVLLAEGERFKHVRP